MKKIVIIEDEDFISKILQIKLKNSEMDLLVARDGESGLEMVKKQKPDLVLLDLILPKMYGFDILKALKDDNSTKKIPVIILTNLGQDEEKQKGMELGALDYFVKANTSLDKIVQRIEEVLG